MKPLSSYDLTTLCETAPDGATITVPSPHVFDFWSDDCRVVEGYHFSNTATYEENPTGRRPVCLYMKGKRGVTIDGGGSTLRIHGIMTPFIFDGCEDLTFRNFRIDYAHPTMSEFTIEAACGAGVYVIRMAPDTLYEIEGGELYFHGEQGRDGAYLWRNHYRENMNIAMQKSPVTEFTQMMGHGGTRFPCVPAFSSIEELGERRLRVTLADPGAFFPVGHTVEVRHTQREQIGGAFVGCRRVLCEELTIHAMHGLGLLGQFSEDLTFRCLHITPASGRTVASNADFFQISGCRGLVTIADCICSDGHDDFVNAHGTHLKILAIDEAEKTLRVRFMQASSWGFAPFAIGDEVEFIDRMTLLPRGSATVTAACAIDPHEYTVTLTDVSPARLDDVLENTSATPALHIHHNRFGPSTGRGILCTTRRPVVIEDNVFYKTGGNVLCIEDDCNFWFESGYTTDVTFRRNECILCGYGSLGTGAVPLVSINPQVLDKSTPIYVHKHIAVIDNRFECLPDAPAVIEVRHTGTFDFRGNELDKEPLFVTESVRELLQ